MCRTPREAGCVMRWTALPRYGKKTRTGLFFVPSRRRCFPRSYGFPAGNVPVSDNIPAGFAVTFLAHFFACPDLFCYLCAAKPGQLPPMRSDASVTAPAVARLRADGRFAGVLWNNSTSVWNYSTDFCIYLIWYLVDILLSINVLMGCLQFWRKV